MRQLAARQPEEFRAVVVDVRSYGLLIELPDVLVSGLIHVSALPEDFYVFDSVRLTFTGRRTQKRFKLGDELRVVVCRVDVYKRQMDFVMVAGSAIESHAEAPRRTSERPGARSDRPPAHGPKAKGRPEHQKKKKRHR